MSHHKHFTVPSLAFLAVALLFTTPADGQFTFGEAVNLGEPVNSSANDFTSDMSDDGLTLVFTRADFTDVEPAGDIWAATRATTSEPWGEPRLLGPAVNSPAAEASPSLSANGLELYFSDSFGGVGVPHRPDGIGKGDLWVAARASINDDFASSFNLGRIVNSTSEDTAPDITSDGRSLFFHSTRANGTTNEIWVTTRTDLTDPLGWGLPVKLGPTVNSSFGDAGPSLSGDGRTMFFGSNRPGGLGGYDIWMTTRSDPSDPLGWGVAVNLGPAVNSVSSDYSPDISADGSTLLFSSDRTGGRLADLWEVSVAADRGEGVLAFQNATIQRDGPRQDEFGTSLLVVEGQASGDSASYGLVRFDLSDVKAQFDRRFGPGDWSVDSVDLVLSQADPFFDAFDGDVEVFFTGDDKVDISQPASALAYPFAGDFADAESILSYAFLPLGDGQRETHTLFDAAGATTPGGVSLMNDILADTTVTLALAESDRSVAAYYAGIAHPDFAGPTLRIAASGAAVPLQAGDADQDLDFDQLDLVRVQIAAKYLTGGPATWGDGDWNGAPGGSPGSPPPGDGRFNQLDIVAAQIAGLYLTGPYAAADLIHVPEPASILLLAVGSLMLVALHFTRFPGARLCPVQQTRKTRAPAG